MRALEGVGVLVTRPQPQSSPLCHRLALEGARAVCFPTIEIQPLGEWRGELARLEPLGNLDLIVFVSANAVRFGAGLLEQRRDLALAAIGPATARALNQAGYRVAVQPDEGFDSESLLRHPRLKSATGKRILIVKGEGGRELLEEELTRRGAQVHRLEVYRRVRLAPSAAEIAALEQEFAAAQLHVVTVTSLEIGTHLLALATPPLAAALARVPWVVPGPRVGAGLRERGLAAPLLVAASAEDQEIVGALLAWRAGESGAKSNESK